jgi:AcrR family transcriptional regulator
MTTGTTGSSTVTARRQRADAQRNAERLLDAARAVFAEHGPEASLEEVARRAEVGIGTLYRHYSTRQALLEAVFRDDVESARARAQELLQSDDPLDALITWLHDQLGQARLCRGLGASVMITMLDEQPELPTPCDAMRESGAALLARAQESGQLRGDATIDDLLRLASAIVMVTEDAPDGTAQAERMFALMMDGMRATPPTK